MDVPQLETPSLLLRALNASDLDELHGLFSNSTLCTALQIEVHQTAKQTEQALAAHLHRQALGQELFWGIAPREENIVIGFCGLKNLQQAGSPELHFAISPDFQQNGWMHTALATMLQYASVRLKLTKIKTFIGADNTAAKHLLSALTFKGKPLREDNTREIWVRK